MSNSRFSLLEIGTEFVFQGQRYRKSTPLLAVDTESNKQRMIPRSAQVELVSQPITETKQPVIQLAGELDPEKVVAAINGLTEQYNQLLQKVSMPANMETISNGKQLITAYREELLKKLGITIY